MLVLSRKETQKIVVGDNIVITVTRIDGNQVRIGFNAPTSVPIIRAELLTDEQLAIVTRKSR